MNYYGAKDLAASFRTVRKNTITVAEDVGEGYYGFRATPETRTIAQTLVHIALSPTFAERIHKVERLATLAGFDFPALFGQIVAEEQKSRNKAEIVALLKGRGDSFAAWLETLNDEFLGEAMAMPPGGTPASRTRFDMLLSVKEHEMHHRGQLMLLERMVGVVPHLTREMQARMAAASAPAAQK